MRKLTYPNRYKDLQFNRPQQLRQDYFSFAAMIILKLTPFKECTFTARIGGLNYIAYIRCKRKNQSINHTCRGGTRDFWTGFYHQKQKE